MVHTFATITDDHTCSTNTLATTKITAASDSDIYTHASSNTDVGASTTCYEIFGCDMTTMTQATYSPVPEQLESPE